MLLVGSYDLYKPVPNMTYSVFVGTLILAQQLMAENALACFVCC